jgi:hypothetical protein
MQDMFRWSGGLSAEVFPPATVQTVTRGQPVTRPISMPTFSFRPVSSFFSPRNVARKDPPGLFQLLFETFRAVAISTCPWFASVQVATVRARVRVLDARQLEVLLPMWTLFLKRGVAEVDLHHHRFETTLE